MKENMNSDLLFNAEIALNNGQYGVALDWFRKAIQENPDDLYTLSRAGAVCVSQQLFDEALQYFSRALQIDPTNGDNHFNLGNAHFFHSDYARAFSLYVEAERIGCSPETMVQLYYQMMLLCTIRQDLDSALIYLKKCEDADPTGTIALTPDFISEKLKIHMLRQDFTAAEKYAAQLVSIQPAQFRHYAVYYSLLMAARDYRTAEKVLDQASHYAVMSPAEQVTLTTQKAALFMALSEQDDAHRNDYHEKAIDVLRSCQKNMDPQDEQYQNVATALCDVYYKAQQYDHAASLAADILGFSYTPPTIPSAEAAKAIQEPNPGDLIIGDWEVDNLLDEHMAELDRQIQNGEINIDEISHDGMSYNEDEIPVIELPGQLLDNLHIDEEPLAHSTEDPIDLHISAGAVLNEASRDKLYFVLISSLLELDKHIQAQKLAGLLKHSNDRYYRYYGMYVETTTCRYTCNDAAQVERAYTKALAFFRSRVAADRKDNLAVIMRARLYAEMGNIEMARQMADMLSGTDREAIIRYIDELHE